MPPVSSERLRIYAEEIAALGALRSSALVRALQTVPRDALLPPGPWIIEAVDGSYHRTPDADPSRILHAVGVVIDAKRELHNANPARIARLIEAADLLPGETVLHVGAGLGYYSAVMAEMVGPKGRVIAAETDPELRAQAEAFLAPWPWVEVVGDAMEVEPPELDLVFSSAGLAMIPPSWTDSLKEGGRLLLPLTGSVDGGYVFLFTSTEVPGWLSARPLTFMRFYPCLGSREAAQLKAMDHALADPKLAEVRWLCTDPHPQNDQCWLHGEGWCITTGDPQR